MDIGSSIIKLRGASQITLPLSLRKAAEISEGDFLEASLTDNGILLRPVCIEARELTDTQLTEIQAVVDAVRKDYAEERGS